MTIQGIKINMVYKSQAVINLDQHQDNSIVKANQNKPGNGKNLNILNQKQQMSSLMADDLEFSQLSKLKKEEGKSSVFELNESKQANPSQSQSDSFIDQIPSKLHISSQKISKSTKDQILIGPSKKIEQNQYEEEKIQSQPDKRQINFKILNGCNSIDDLYEIPEEEKHVSEKNIPLQQNYKKSNLSDISSSQNMEQNSKSNNSEMGGNRSPLLINQQQVYMPVQQRIFYNSNKDEIMNSLRDNFDQIQLDQNNQANSHIIQEEQMALVFSQRREKEQLINNVLNQIQESVDKQSSNSQHSSSKQIINRQ